MKAKTKKVMKEIDAVKAELQSIGAMRPGSVNEQFKDPTEKTGSYFQLNYTHKMKTHTEYVRKKKVEKIKAETVEYKKFKVLTEKWVILSIEASKLRIAES